MVFVSFKEHPNVELKIFYDEKFFKMFIAL